MKNLIYTTALVFFCFALQAQNPVKVANPAKSDTLPKYLTIIHTNDTHSHLEPIRGGRNNGLGGVIERAAFIDSVRRADGANNVLLLDAGDFSQGSPYFSRFKGDLEISLINAMGYDVECLGNHEFDNGIEELARRLDSLHCPIVCANYDFSSTPLASRVKPYVILHKAGMKIGVFGMLTDLSLVSSKKTAARLKKLNNAEVANKWATFLKKKEHCDLVIALTHIGYANEEYTDPEMVRESRNIDLVVGGHSHTFLKTVKYAKNLDGKEIPIVQDGCWGLYVGLMKYPNPKAMKSHNLSAKNR